MTADFEAIDSGHHNIEYSQVKYLSIKQCEGRIARVATRDGKTLTFEHMLEKVGDLDLIIAY